MRSQISATTEELSVAACWELLRGSPVGRLAVIFDDSPEIFPLNYVVEHGSIVVRTAAGTKLAGARNRRVAFEADGYDAQAGTAWSVVAKGVATAILDVDESLSAMALPLVPWQDGNKPWFLRLVPTAVTGRRLHVSGGARSDPQGPSGDPHPS